MFTLVLCRDNKSLQISFCLPAIDTNNLSLKNFLVFSLNSAEYGGVSLLRGDPVIRLDPDKHTVTLASGRQIVYERCLLATGGRPKRLHQLEHCSQTGEDLRQSGYVSYFRTLADYRYVWRVIVSSYVFTTAYFPLFGSMLHA